MRTQEPSSGTADVTGSASNLAARIRRQREAISRRWRGLGFGPRLLVAIVVALGLVGVAAYTLISERLQQQLIDSYAAELEADATGFEQIGRVDTRKAVLREIEEQLRGIGRRPGVEGVYLISPDNTIVASNRSSVIGDADFDPPIAGALADGTSYAGREAQPKLDSEDFEFVTPVELPNGRHALELGFSHEAFDAQLAEMRRLLVVIGLLALFGVTALFYLFGGRSLLRSHGAALQRATRDGLTDLPNHRAFQEDLEQAVTMAARHHDPLALAVLDLDHFKVVNDRHGHPAGDELLKRVTLLLREGRSGDRAYRIGGDEFALLLPHTDADGSAISVRRLSRTMNEAGIAASIGVSTIREGQQGDELRAEADVALYEAKRRGGRQPARFEEISDDVAVTTSSKREAVRRMIEEQRLNSVYQPIWDFGSGRLLGVEALMRPDPDQGLAGPAEAFDIAEQTGLAHDLDVLSATSALRIGTALPAGAALFVNINPKTLELDAQGNDWLRDAVEAAGLSVDRVVIEVTERLGARTARVIEALSRLRKQGFRLALDDVGTGNAGLEMLHKIDAEFVKLDRSIVAAAALEPTARAVLMAMATFAHQTGAFVIAEGIEDEETLEFVRGIDEFDHRSGTIIQGGQGYGLGRPSHGPPEQLPAMLADAGGDELEDGARSSPKVLVGATAGSAAEPAAA